MRGPLAKISRPRLARAVPRERLFAMLDAARAERPGCCVVSPPGSGKTTLISTWIEARAIPAIWYQVDAGDADLPTFFHYLALALHPFAGARKRPLPSLTAEYLEDVSGFSRRFFRELFGRLPHGAVLVLDNYQEVPTGSAFHRLISDAVGEVSPGGCLIAISRRDPPECYARLIANEKVILLDWTALQLTLEEARHIAAARGETDAAAVAAMQAQCEGWAAGLTLMLERRARRVANDTSAQPEVTPEVFDYFAAEIFDRLPRESQDILLALSFVPRVSSRVAEQVTRHANAVSVLESLHRTRLFTERRPGVTPVYQFHALFLAFLRARARQALSAEQFDALRLRAAEAMLASGEAEEATSLYVEGGGFDLARSVILAHAGAWIAQGRSQLVVQFIERMVTDRSTQECWLLYWKGAAVLGTDPDRAREAFEKSYHLACHDQDRGCALHAAAGAVQAIMFAYANFRGLDIWIDVIRAQLKSPNRVLDVDTELRAQCSLLAAYSQRRPDDPDVDACAARVYELIAYSGDPNLAVTAAAYLVTWGTTSGPIETATQALAQLQKLLRQASVGAMNRAWALFLISWYHCLTGDRARCLEVVAQIESIAEQEGLTSLRRFSAIIGCWVEIHQCNIDAAQAWSRVLEQVVDPRSLFDKASLEAGEAWLAILRTEPTIALARARKAIEFFDASGSIMHRCNHRLSCIWGHIQLREYDQARCWIGEARALARRMRSNWQEIALRASEAWLALEVGDRASALERLTAAFQMSHMTGYDHALGQHMRPWMSRLCAHALEANIETGYVSKLIRRFRWAAPPSRPQHWPWPVRIHTLGVFQLFIDGTPAVFGHKAPRKPLALLKAIVALGGERVPEQRLIDALWPDEDGDHGHQAFTVAMQRLRKLLGRQDAVQLSEGLVSLNGECIWTDIDGFERLLLDDATSADNVLAHYRGEFLSEEGSAPWAVLPRERLRMRFVEYATAAGARLEQRQAWPDARSLYTRALEADSLSETFYQGLMRCHLAQGRASEGLSVFRRTRQTLSITLGVAPSAESMSCASS